MTTLQEQLTRALMRSYVAMLACHDWRWRLEHQAELCAARDALADVTGIPSQYVQESCEALALSRAGVP